MPVQQRRPNKPVFESIKRGPLKIVGWSLPLLLLVSGCAGTKGETEDPEVAAQRETEIAQLRRENASLKSEIQNLEERLRLVEQAEGSYASTSVGSVGYDSYSVEPVPGEWEQTPTDQPRELPVVRITPNHKGGTPRPPAQGTARVRPSDPVALDPGPGPSGESSYVVDARGGVDHSGSDPSGWDEAPPPEGAETPSYRLVGSRLVQATQRSKPQPKGGKSSKDSRVVKDYKAAMAVYRDGRYAEAEAAFASIVSAHPNHDYADNALYWQGEAAYDQAHYADALAAFTRVVERYGGGNKAADALLKIGLCYGRLGDQANARDVLTQLIAAYPRADASKIAKRKLAELD